MCRHKQWKRNIHIFIYAEVRLHTVKGVGDKMKDRGLRWYGHDQRRDVWRLNAGVHERSRDHGRFEGQREEVVDDDKSTSRYVHYP